MLHPIPSRSGLSVGPSRLFAASSSSTLIGRCPDCSVCSAQWPSCMRSPGGGTPNGYIACLAASSLLANCGEWPSVCTGCNGAPLTGCRRCPFGFWPGLGSVPVPVPKPGPGVAKGGEARYGPAGAVGAVGAVPPPEVPSPQLGPKVDSAVGTVPIARKTSDGSWARVACSS